MIGAYRIMMVMELVGCSQEEAEAFISKHRDEK